VFALSSKKPLAGPDFDQEHANLMLKHFRAKAF
jgi:hypothetical protein